MTSAFWRFSLVGVAGFGVDTLSLFSLIAIGFHPLFAKVLSYVIAASFTWALNRTWTFRNKSKGLLRQWMKFLAANAVGGVMNYLVYAAFILFFDINILSHATIILLGNAAGSLAGLFVNFALSRHLVFAPRPLDPQP